MSFSRFFPPGPGFPPVFPPSPDPYRVLLSLDDGILSYQVNLPFNREPWDVQILQFDKHHAIDSLVFDLGTCRKPMPPFNGFPPIPEPPGQPCFVFGSVTLTQKQIHELLSETWILDAGLSGSIYGPILIREAIVPDDSDADGVPDYRDFCPNTPQDETVNHHGCSLQQLRPPRGSSL